MKKMIKTSFIYAIAAMAGGVFYREFTKFRNFDGETSLSLVHTHLFMLGMFMFLIAALFVDKYKLEKNRRFQTFYILYNIGVPVTAIMLFVRGITQTMSSPLSRALDASISGIAGIGHIFTGLGIIFLFLSILKNCEQ